MFGFPFNLVIPRSTKSPESPKPHKPPQEPKSPLSHHEHSISPPLYHIKKKRQRASEQRGTSHTKRKVHFEELPIQEVPFEDAFEEPPIEEPPIPK